MDARPPLSPPDSEIHALDPESYEAAVMAGDSAASEWLHGAFEPEDDRPSAAVLEEKPGEGRTEDDDGDGWLPLLTPEDCSLVREYMQARNFPTIAVESLGEWPTGELRHLLANARIWKVAEAQRVAERAESDQLLKELGQRRAENRAVLERLSRDQATALLARDADKSLILLSAREARRTPSGNHVDGNPGVDLERQLRQVASERGFAAGPAHWESASKRLVIDLYHLDAEAWWNSGRARGLVRVPPNSKVLESKRTYRALYPFQRAAINAAHVKSCDRSEFTLDASPSEPARLPNVAESVGHPLLKEPVQLPEPGPSSAHAVAALSTAATAPSSEPAAPRPASTGGGGQPVANKPPTVPNARKGYKLTLWVTATTDAGLADATGLVQLDGADPTPFCQLKAVQNPLARALQEAFLAIEQVRARPPKMAAPPASPAAPPPTVVSRPRPAARATTSEVAATPSGSRAPIVVNPSAPVATAARRQGPSQQPSLF